MREAAEQLRNEIRRINWGSLAFPVVSNVTAREFNQEGLEEGLVRQLYYPVRWQQSIEYLAPRVDYFIEAGPGKTLSGLVKKIYRKQILGNVEDPASLGQIMGKISNVSRSE